MTGGNQRMKSAHHVQLDIDWLLSRKHSSIVAEAGLLTYSPRVRLPGSPKRASDLDAPLVETELTAAGTVPELHRIPF